MELKQRQALRAAIDSGNLLPAVRAVVERSGDEGFDSIARELNSGTLSPRQEINALRAMSLISRQFAPGRKSELLASALRLATSEDLAVRSAAVHMVIWTRQILRALGASIPEERVRSVVNHALQLGLLDAEEALANRYLRGEPLDVDVVELDVKIPPEA